MSCLFVESGGVCSSTKLVEPRSQRFFPPKTQHNAPPPPPDAAGPLATTSPSTVTMSLALLPLKIILVTLDLFVSTQMLVDVSRRLVNLMLT